jgi:hypothetical protein
MRKVDIARKYREDYGMEMPTLKLARIIYKDNNILFKDVEDVRSYLKYIEGKNGAKNKNALPKSNSKFVVDAHRPRNPYKLP